MQPKIIPSHRTPLQAALLLLCAAALVTASLFALAQQVYAADVAPPAVPANLAVPEGNQAFLVGHAVGTQNYVCRPFAESPTGVAFRLFTPQATLFDDEGKQIITHFFSPNPAEGGTVRPAWQDSKDTSRVWAMMAQATHTSSDPAYVQPGAVAWLLLTVVGNQTGPSGGDRLTKTTFIHRVNTSGGPAPTTGCGSTADLGNQAFVPYTADYYFYRAKGN
jgi:hypothetical protein